MYVNDINVIYIIRSLSAPKAIMDVLIYSTLVACYKALFCNIQNANDTLLLAIFLSEEILEKKPHHPSSRMVRDGLQLSASVIHYKATSVCIQKTQKCTYYEYV